MRIALFGGSFNPIHNGHIAIADAIIEQGLAEEVWLQVSPQNPLKEQGGLAPEELRLHWAQMAAQGHTGVKASDYEFRLPRPSYTYLTLRQLREDYPQDEFLLCIGEDNWVHFQAWRNPDEILRHHTVIVYPRHVEQREDLPPVSDNVVFLKCPLVDVSSTQIRQRLAQGQGIEGLVPDILATTIPSEWKQNNL